MRIWRVRAKKRCSLSHNRNREKDDDDDYNEDEEENEENDDDDETYWKSNKRELLCRRLSHSFHSFFFSSLPYPLFFYSIFYSLLVSLMMYVLYCSFGVDLTRKGKGVV